MKKSCVGCRKLRYHNEELINKLEVALEQNYLLNKKVKLFKDIIVEAYLTNESYLTNEKNLKKINKIAELL